LGSSGLPFEPFPDSAPTASTGRLVIWPVNLADAHPGGYPGSRGGQRGELLSVEWLAPHQ